MRRIYLAIPYSSMKESSFKQANEYTVAALKMGYNVFSPITYSHILAELGLLPSDWKFWEKINKDWISTCDELWVIIPEEGMDKVRDSVGVQAEIKYAEELGIPVKRIHGQTLRSKLLQHD